MKKLSKKEEFRLRKQKDKRKKKIMIWAVVIIVFLALFFWLNTSAKNSPEFSNPSVSKGEVPVGQIHWHPKLEIKINGESIRIPNNIGIGGGVHFPTHTHAEGDGTIHLENMDPSSQPETMALGYFFNIWRQVFNQTCILDKCTNVDGGEIYMYVNGEENFEYERYVFKGEDIILIEYVGEGTRTLEP